MLNKEDIISFLKSYFGQQSCMASVTIKSQTAYIQIKDQFVSCPIDDLAQTLSEQGVSKVLAIFKGEKIKLPYIEVWDVLELLAFVYPNFTSTPSIYKVAQLFNLDLSDESQLYTAPQVAVTEAISNIQFKQNKVQSILIFMATKGWNWAKLLCDCFEINWQEYKNTIISGEQFLNVWEDLAKWEFNDADDERVVLPMSEKEVDDSLKSLVSSLKEGATPREAQKDFAQKVGRSLNESTKAQDKVKVHILEAATGVGKTAGYMAPALRFAQKSGTTAWVSTFTKNLQQQAEHTAKHMGKTLVRKGRENYICLLKYQGAVSLTSSYSLGFLARWIQDTTYGDYLSGDFPRWLPQYIDQPNLFHGLTDKRGDCIFTACPHYRKCFIERNIQESFNADVVIANHAFTIFHGALGDSQNSPLASNLIFDEAHHLFDAADNAFSIYFSARQLREFQSWLGDMNKKGYLHRVQEVLNFHSHLPTQEALTDVTRLISHLPQEGWGARIERKMPIDGNITETFFSDLNTYIETENQATQSVYENTSLETPFYDSYLEQDSFIAAKAWVITLTKKFGQLFQNLNILLEELDPERTDMCQRTQGLIKSTEAKLVGLLLPYKELFEDLNNQSFAIDWAENHKPLGALYDVGIKRHIKDPMQSFHKLLTSSLRSVTFTSATLSDSSQEKNVDADVLGLKRTEVETENYKSSYPSPFNYAQNSIVIIVEDVDYNHIAQLTHAFGRLFKASNGGALGLFTAIQRLRGVYPKLKKGLEKYGIELFAQHESNLDNNTLVELFKEEENACLLGTDAMRQGVDVPGKSLRLVVCDKLPRAVPSHLFKERVKHFGGQYSMRQVRMALKQAFGRLIRSDSDRGVFVMLDKRINNGELKAFPPETPVVRCSLDEAVMMLEDFYAES